MNILPRGGPAGTGRPRDKAEMFGGQSVHTMHAEIFIGTKAEIAEEVVEIV